VALMASLAIPAFAGARKKALEMRVLQDARNAALQAADQQAEARRAAKAKFDNALNAPL